MRDLFEFYEEQPQEVKEILSRYESEEQDYRNCENLLSELETVGYTFEYGLDAQPFNLMKILSIGQKISCIDCDYGFTTGEVVNITDAKYCIKWEDIPEIIEHPKSHAKEWENSI